VSYPFGGAGFMEPLPTKEEIRNYKQAKESIREFFTKVGFSPSQNKDFWYFRPREDMPDFSSKVYPGEDETLTHLIRKL